MDVHDLRGAAERGGGRISLSLCVGVLVDGWKSIMERYELSEDSQVICMLCAELAEKPEGLDLPKPLGNVEWSRLAECIEASEWSGPGALLGKSAADMTGALSIGAELAERVARRLDMGFSLVNAARLRDRGIWICTRADSDYPPLLVKRLNARAPAVLFGFGPGGILSQPGVAVIGSRNVDEEGSRFAGDVGARLAESGVSLISGGARGVDRLAMMGALETGSGVAVGVLADSLERAAARCRRARLRRQRTARIHHALPSIRALQRRPRHGEEFVDLLSRGMRYRGVVRGEKGRDLDGCRGDAEEEMGAGIRARW